MGDTDRRQTKRVQTRFESLYSAGRSEGTGMLSDISYSGALINSASLLPEVGKLLRIYVFVQPVDPFEMVGTVVRHTENGFAIAYDAQSSELKQFVDDAAAMMDPPPEAE